MTNQEICTSINVLIKSCNEVESVFRRAADNVHSPELSLIIAALGKNCQQRARELQNHLVQLGGHTPARGHPGDAAQRVWLSVRKLFCLNADLELLKDCKSLENKAISQYRLTLDQPLPAPLHKLINRQLLVAIATVRALPT